MARKNDRDEPKDEVVERGSIYFLFRPKVGPGSEDAGEDVTGLGDVQRFEIVLKPDGRSLFRLLVIGGKQLPDVTRHERTWGFVEAIETSAKKLEQGLRQSTYQTKTRGERTVPAVRPAGEGRYALLYHAGTLHLIYALELPTQPGAVQRALNIAPEAAFALSVKNPDKPSPQGAGLSDDQQASYPKSLQKAFRGRKFADESPQMLDYEGAELVLVGAREDPEGTYDVELRTREGDDIRSKTMRELKMARSRHPIEPLFEGRWS